jgi:hypothetical protein
VEVQKCTHDRAPGYGGDDVDSPEQIVAGERQEHSQVEEGGTEAAARQREANSLMFWTHGAD